MPSAAEDISAAISAAGGPISFERFMTLALYSKHGFYTNTGQAGRRGDFITSPEVGPLFGTVLARVIDSRWNELGCPKKFTVVDAGAGPGTLARSINSAQLECRDALRYVAVEYSASQRALHPKEVISQAEMPSDPFVGLIFANELLDNLAFRLFVFDRIWQEAFVVEQSGRFMEVLRTVSDTPEYLPLTPQHGARVPVQRQAQQWIASALKSISDGSVIVFDYCMTTQIAATRPWRDWLRTYRQHESGEHYLRQAGEQDITTHVMLDQMRLLNEPTKISSQADWLADHGIHELVGEGRNYWQAHAAKPDLQAMLMRSRVRESEALCAPDGLGNFTVLEWATP